MLLLSLEMFYALLYPERLFTIFYSILCVTDLAKLLVVSCLYGNWPSLPKSAISLVCSVDSLGISWEIIGVPVKEYYFDFSL